MNSQVLKKLNDCPIIAILRGIAPEYMEDTVMALYRGGIRMVEITFDQRSSTRLQDTGRSIRAIRSMALDDLLVGAGTVLSVEEVEAAAQAGASFVLSPNVNADVIRAAVQAGMEAIPGAMTPTEIEYSYRCGASLVKLFPAGTLGVSYLRAVTAPLSHVPILVVGDITTDNLTDFLKAGARGAGIGSNLANPKLAANRDFDAITRLAQTYCDLVGREKTDV